MTPVSIDQRLPVSLSITDRAGNPAAIDGVPAWSTSDSALGIVEDISADGLSAYVTPADGAADQVFDVTVEVDADVGDGVRPLIGVLQVAVTGGSAQFVELVAGTPEPKPSA